MAVERKSLIAYAERAIVIPLRITFRSARHHPLVFSLVLYLVILHTYCPSLFAFLVSNSPILACTTVLLGLLLSYGEPNLPDFEVDCAKTRNVSSLKVQSTADDLFFIKKDKNFVIEKKHTDYVSEVEEAASGESSLNKENTKFSLLEEEDYVHKAGKKEDEEFENVATSLSRKDEEKVCREETSKSVQMSKNSEIYIDKLNETFVLGVDVSAFRSEEKKESKSINLEPPHETEQLDASSLVSYWKHGVDDAFSDSESDRAEISSPDASMANIIPMLDELDPLLNIDNSQHFLVPNNDSVSEESSEDHEFDDSSDKEESEHNGNEEVQGAQEGKEDETAAAVKWTEDDQKNVMVLGSSEVERNMRLESLIAKRRARKNLAMLMERNLIDLDVDLPVPPPISAPMRNPFDPSSSDHEETNGLPPIPGSAPSSMILRKNPFDFLYDQEDETSNFMGESSRYMPVPQSDMFFRRNETVNFARMELVQERRRSRLKPYFVTERMDSEEGSSSNLHSQLYERSDSKVSSVAESDSISSSSDMEDNKELLDEDLNHEFQLSPFNKHESVDLASFGAGLLEEYSLDSNMLMGVSLADLSQRPFESSSSIQAATDGIDYPETPEMHQSANSNIEELPIADKYQGFTPDEEDCFEIHDPAGVVGVQLADELDTGSDADSGSQKPENSTSSFVFPASPLHDDSSDTGLPCMERTESVSTGYSRLSELESELKFMSSSNVAHSSDSRLNANQETHLIVLDSSEDELEVTRPKISEAGEEVLSELDAVGDFRIEDSVSDPQGAGQMLQMESENIDSLSLSSYVHDNPLNKQSSENGSILYTELAISLVPELSLDGSKEMHSAQQQLQAIDPEAGFSFRTFHGYPEQVQDLIESVSKQLPEEAMDSSALESDIGKLKTVKYDNESSSADENYGTMEDTLPDSELIVLEAKSTEEILSAFKQVKEEATDSSVSATNLDCLMTEKSVPEANKTDFTIMTVKKTVSDSGFLVHEANSTGDIPSPFEQIKEEATCSSVSRSKIDQVISVNCDHDAREADSDNRNMEKQMHDSELVVLEARSTEDIQSAFEQIKEESVKTAVVALVVQSSEDIQGKEHHEALETQSDQLHVIEAKSFDGIQDAIKQLTDSANEHTSELMAGERNLELEVLDAQSVEQIELAFKKVVAKETNLGEEIGQESGAEAVHDVAVSSSSASRNLEKEPKSDSSSSSDSTDSE